MISPGAGVEIGVEVLILGVGVCGEDLDDFLIGGGELSGAAAGREVDGGGGGGDKGSKGSSRKEDGGEHFGGVGNDVEMM